MGQLDLRSKRTGNLGQAGIDQVGRQVRSRPVYILLGDKDTKAWFCITCEFLREVQPKKTMGKYSMV